MGKRDSDIRNENRNKENREFNGAIYECTMCGNRGRRGSQKGYLPFFFTEAVLGIISMFDKGISRHHMDCLVIGILFHSQRVHEYTVPW